MATPYVYERQVEYWTSRGIENFFLDAGLEVLVLPLTQLTERNLPSDFLFLDSEEHKLFGLQFKALYRNAFDFWPLDIRQHGDLSAFKWMYYGFSDLTSGQQQRNALHYLRIASTSFDYIPRVPRGGFYPGQKVQYVRWAGFFEGLQKCSSGLKVSGAAEITRALWPRGDQAAPREITQIAHEVFIMSLKRPRVVRFSTLLAPEGNAG